MKPLIKTAPHAKLHAGRQGFVAIVLLPGMLGTFLLPYSTGDQILPDDKWRDIFFAPADKTKIQGISGAQKNFTKITVRLFTQTKA